LGAAVPIAEPQRVSDGLDADLIDADEARVLAVLNVFDGTVGAVIGHGERF
jgi:hypothetical protein